MTALLSIDSLCRDFGAVRVLDHLSMTVTAGELVCVIGPNGCGKTTLFNIVTGELAPSAGRIDFDGRSLIGLAPHKIAQCGVARKFQVPSVFADLSVRDNLGVAQYASQSTEEMMALDAMLDAIQLRERSEQRAGDLPHGGRQWLEIGMALAQRPRLLLLDEPTAGMTASETLATAKLLKELIHHTGTSCIVIEHDMRFVQALGSRVLALLSGKIIADDTFDQVRKIPAVQAAYLGQGVQRGGR